MKTNVIIERASDGAYSLYMDRDDLKIGLYGYGTTVAEAKDDFMQAYSEALELYPDNMIQLDFEFSYDIASFINYFKKKITLAGLENITGVNQKQLGHYASGLKKPTKATVAKIERGIKQFQQELADTSFVS